MKTLSELQALCQRLGIVVPGHPRAAKEPYLLALRHHLWDRDHPGQVMPPQIEPMLLGDWDNDQPEHLESDESNWCVQEKKDGVRALLHVTPDGIRITGRTISEVTFRMTEFQENLPHLATGFKDIIGTVFDGELVCPVTKINTGSTVTVHPLQAAGAILATDPRNAQAIQDRHNAQLAFHVFDILQLQNDDLTPRPLWDRLTALDQVMKQIENAHIHPVPTQMRNKRSFHDAFIAEGMEGSVWKDLNSAYQVGRRVGTWLKRKRRIEIEAEIIGYKLGSSGRGNAHLVGAVEFGRRGPDGSIRPIAWVSNWADAERAGMTISSEDGPRLRPEYFGRRAIVVGQDDATRCGRIRHARFRCWLRPRTDSIHPVDIAESQTA